MSDTKLRSLDALRGLAILLVISAHFGGGSVFQQAMLGNAGVILFFFLSGFLMDRTLSRDANPASYAVHRAFRIMPMYLLSIALVIVLGPHWTLGEVVSNATFTAPAFGAQRMLGVYWTLYIEVLFYLIAPFLMIAGIRAVQYLTYAALALFAVFALTSGVGSGAPFYLIFCVCGMQIGSWYRGDVGGVSVSLSIVAVAISASLLMPVSILLGIIPAACACALVFCLRNNPRLFPMEFVGWVSYSWYLLHSIFGYKFPPAVGISLTFLASVVCYYTVERPLIDFSKRLLPARPLRSLRSRGFFGVSTDV